MDETEDGVEHSVLVVALAKHPFWFGKGGGGGGGGINNELDKESPGVESKPFISTDSGVSAWELTPLLYGDGVSFFILSQSCETGRVVNDDTNTLV